MKERYLIIKKFYKDYLICFIKKGKYNFYDVDKLIIKYFDINSINILYVDNLCIIKVKKYKNNLYKLKLSKSLLIENLRAKALDL